MTPGGALLRWPPAAAALLIAVNDLYLKPQHPGWWSGKLSDFGLCFFAPVWMFTVWECVTWLLARARRRPWLPPGAVAAALSCGAVGAWLSALQLWPAAARFHVEALGWAFGRRFVVTPDPTDLLALAVLPLTFAYLRAAAAGASARPGRPR
jgi:hypothetical protein